MEQYLLELETARKSIKSAEHMVTMTYDVINDPKLFVTLAQRMYSAAVSIMRAILFFERYQRKIPAFDEDVLAMLELFKIRTTRRYSLSMDYAKLIEELRAIVDGYKKSPVAFKRKENYVICDDKYNLNVLTKEKSKLYLDRTKKFLSDAEQMIAKQIAKQII
ncbi:hypothetical protein HZA96_01730 [Candidatus Woesearchaeota archaeon]|nr:hypothetical protein [Candidatus Woesearchaeota archaeon]